MDNIAILCGLAVIFASTRWLFFGDSNKYAPGPYSPIPYVRNAFQLPVHKPWDVYMKWTKTYKSSILYARAFGQKVLVLNSFDDAIELLEERARKTSDRPAIVLIELMGWGNMVSISRYGDLWRKQRRLTHNSMKNESEKIESYRPIIEEGVKRLAKRLIEDGLEAGINSLIRFQEYSGGVIISLTYGYKLTDPAAAALVKDISGLADTASAVLVPGAYLVSIVPALRHIPSWLPGGAFHKVVGDCKAKTRKLCEITYRFTKEKLERSWAHPEEEGLDAGGPNDRDADLKLTPGESMVEQWLKAADVQDTPTMDGIEAGLGSLIGGVSQEVIIQDTALTVFVAGYDTSAATLSWFTLAMAKYPEVQKKAQDTLCAVLGPNTLPTFQDRPSLPYIEAIYMETLRWRPTTPLGMPHLMSEDDVYKGYLIPAGTIMLSNIWAMTRDEVKYPNPEEFIPERYLNEDGSVKSDERVLTYGFGRRICVGKNVASDVVWMAMAMMLATLHIAKDKDEQGNEVQIQAEPTSGASIHPTSTPCSITKRRDVEI